MANGPVDRNDGVASQIIQAAQHWLLSFGGIKQQTLEGSGIPSSLRQMTSALRLDNLR
jgi:hypothetical protein